MCGINLGISAQEYHIQSREASYAHRAFSDIKKQAIKDAQESWKSPEVQDSLERSYQECKKLEESESKKNDIKLVDTKLKIVQWVMLQIRASYSWQDKS